LSRHILEEIYDGIKLLVCETGGDGLIGSLFNRARLLQARCFLDDATDGGIVGQSFGSGAEWP
jgi:hypothetical protein